MIKDPIYILDLVHDIRIFGVRVLRYINRDDLEQGILKEDEMKTKTIKKKNTALKPKNQGTKATARKTVAKAKRK